MRQQDATTPFGRRPASLGQIAARMRVAKEIAAAAEPGSNHPAAVNKWTLYRTVTTLRDALGLSDRTLAVLNALLSFHPETALTLPNATAPDEDGESGDAIGLVVFPSNRQLAARSNGMAEKTLRRHLAALVEAGLIFRRDSPNGKRYARRGGEGDLAQAFGFDLTPLVARAPELEAAAERQRRQESRRAALKERVSLLRRDVGKLIALGLDEALPGDWETCRRRYMALLQPLRRIRDDAALESLIEELSELRRVAETQIERQLDVVKSTGSAATHDRQQSNSNPETPEDFEPASKEAGSDTPAPQHEIESAPSSERKQAEMPPLGMVLEACPDLLEHADGPIRSWPRFAAVAAQARPMLGISRDAWRDAVDAMGEAGAAIALAVILQRSEHSSEAEPAGPSGALTVNGSPAIRSPGGYLRALADKARAGAFTPGPILMALIAQRLKARR
jgi:replication initiation protein RepC